MTADRPRRPGQGEVTALRRQLRETKADSARSEKAAAKLRRSEDLYRSTVNALSIGIHVVDRELRITLINDTLKRLSERLGLQPGRVGQELFDVFPMLSDDVRDEYR